MLTQENIQEYVPKQGIIIYNRYAEYYLETHEIVNNDGKFEWMEGKPFHKDHLKALALSLGKQSMTMMHVKGLLPENVLYYQPSFFGNAFIWHVPSGLHHFSFKSTLKLKEGNYRMPGLIFAVNDKALYVFAYKGTNKPTAKTELFKGPFFNVYQDSKVCMGTTRESAKKNVLQEEMARWERRFYGSRFTHVSDSSVLKKGFKINTVYNKIRNARKFPEGCLAPAKYKTLDSFTKHFIKYKGNED